MTEAQREIIRDQMMLCFPGSGDRQRVYCFVESRTDEQLASFAAKPPSG
jgi:hypothetical protein